MCVTIRAMHFLKRIELWVLLVALVAGLAWVFTSSGGGGDEEPVQEGPAATGSSNRAPLVLHRCVLKRDYGNARLDIELKVRNDSATPLVMQAPKVKLLAAAGREVPSFFLPFDPIPEVPAQSSQDVQLRYWLESADLKEALTLHVEGNTVLVKSSTPFDLETVKNGEEKILQPGSW